MQPLIPVEGCFVADGSNGPLGQVTDRRVSDARAEVRVRWADGTHTWRGVDTLSTGLQRGWLVQDVPLTTTRRSLGPGRVVGTRKLGGRQQHLVQLEQTGESVWLPYENLRRLKDVQMRYERGELESEHYAERFRLRMLAHALENWNNMTGSLDRLDVDPLPHQIQLVHRIVSSGQYNWLIADDVGLGKTIEVGLLLAALKRKGFARRVLIVCPAGLTRQWQDEMKTKFDQDYLIYQRDFAINDEKHWKLYDHVIASIDLAKRSEHMDKFKAASAWDVVIFDEGHKLTRYASGERVDRYKLAEMLRPRADAFLLLTGTPHQGYNDRFKALLELVRPDLQEDIRFLESNPDIVGDMILRNKKNEVTDSDGNFIFKGQKIHRVPITPSSTTLKFQRQLNRYLQRGYRVGETQGKVGRAIGFVMTTYRKLASSSIAAIERALHRRLERLHGSVAGPPDGDEIDLDLEDLTEGGDDQDLLDTVIDTTKATEFFDFEKEMLESLIDQAAHVRNDDEKLRIFLEEVVEPLAREQKKLLVFTEYRATQDYLVNALRTRFADAGETVVINGSMNLQEKMDAISDFNNEAAFLVSTEAGGEGINLHRACHVMLNYDLPWNPARLVQRIGRLYRYGQQYPVIVFNLHARDSFDNSAIDLMMQRVMQIAQDMAPVADDFNDRLYADILGEMLERIDLSQVFNSALGQREEQTQQQIDQAIQRAQQARQLQAELFHHVAGYDPDAIAGTIGFSMDHVAGFVRDMLPFVGVQIDGQTHGGNVLSIKLPEELRGRFPEFQNRTQLRVTTDRRRDRYASDVHILDFENTFFQYLTECATSHQFGGLVARVERGRQDAGTLAAFKVRWQNDQGRPNTEEFVPVWQDTAGQVWRAPRFVSEFLLQRQSDGQLSSGDRSARSDVYRRLLADANQVLSQNSGRYKHPNDVICLGIAELD